MRAETSSSKANIKEACQNFLSLIVPPLQNVVICAKISLIAHNGLLYLNWINKNQFLVLISNVMTVYILSPSKQNSLDPQLTSNLKMVLTPQDV